MCFHVAKFRSKGLEQRFKAYIEKEQEREALNDLYHVSGFSRPLLPIITNEKPDKIQLYHWGLIPKWARDKKTADEWAKNCLNAQSETIFEKKSFQTVTQNRCLVLVDGFYEWRHLKGKTYPYFIKLKNDETFALGGLYNDWTDKATGELIKTFSILTTDANPLMAIIHNTKKRMPFILDRVNERLWLEKDFTEPKMTEIMKPYNETEMEAYTISRLISERGANTNVPQVKEPFTYPELAENITEPKQGSLFKF